MSVQPDGRRPASRFAADDSDVIVVIGSGAGGGTLANELCQRGAKVVLLEAGPHHQPEDFINDEWASLNQLAWLDERTTSGSWRIAREFPNLPAWTCKTVGGTTVHWAGCCPRFKEWEFRIRSEHGPIDGANLLDWPIGLSDLEPYYDRGRGPAGRHAHERDPGAAGQQQLQGDGQRRQARRLHGRQHGPDGVQHGAARRSPGHDPGRLQLSRATSSARTGRR